MSMLALLVNATKVIAQSSTSPAKSLHKLCMLCCVQPAKSYHMPAISSVTDRSHAQKSMHQHITMQAGSGAAKHAGQVIQDSI